MLPTILETKRLNLVLQTHEEVRAQLEQMPAYQRDELSADWLELFEASGEADPWVHGFRLIHRVSGSTIGRAGFKGPPGPDGVVEIAYGVDTQYQGKGYATEAAAALVRYAFTHPDVLRVRAHTLPESNASTSVLTKCGFQHLGEVVDPEDGPVWRWERERQIE